MNYPQLWIEHAFGYAVDWGSTSGWAQALGAFVAIIATAWIANGEARDRRAREVAEREASRRRQHALVHGARVLIDDAASALHVLNVTRSGDLNYQVALGRVQSAAEGFQRFPIYSLEHQRCVEMVQIVQGALSRALQADAMPLNVTKTLVYESTAREAQAAQAEMLEIVLAKPFAGQQ